jgi:hypothetical protein
MELQGVKHDQDKPKMDLLPPYALEGAAKILTFGAKKYGAHNWRKGMLISRLVAACLRHLMAFMRGETLDPESGMPHIDHALTNLMMASEIMATQPECDDRECTKQMNMVDPMLDKPGVSIKRNCSNCRYFNVPYLNPCGQCAYHDKWVKRSGMENE